MNVVKVSGHYYGTHEMRQCRRGAQLQHCSITKLVAAVYRAQHLPNNIFTSHNVDDTNPGPAQDNCATSM